MKSHLFDFRHKQNRRDKRRLNPPPPKRGQRGQPPRNNQGQPQYSPYNPPPNGYASNPNNPNDNQVHDMLYGRGPPRRPKKKKQSDCSIM